MKFDAQKQKFLTLMSGRYLKAEMSKEIHEMTLCEAKTELEKLRTELCLKYHADGDEKTKKLIQAISIVIDNCHYSFCL